MNAALDAGVCLLLVGAAVFGLVTVPDPVETADDGRADAVAESLATTTAAVNYSLGTGGGGVASDPSMDAPRPVDRTAHGSLAGLLARAAAGAVEIDGTGRLPPRDGFRAAVREAVAARYEFTGLRVEAVWRPYRGAPIGGRVAVGPEPPTGQTVHAATLSVPTGVSPLSESAAMDFESVSVAVARSTVDAVVPPDEARLALRSGPPASRLTRSRYARLGETVGTSVDEAVAADATREANDRLAAALAPRVASDLRERFESPAAAVEAAERHRVRVVVRTWNDATTAETTRRGGD
jgi:hypothetical protein